MSIQRTISSVRRKAARAFGDSREKHYRSLYKKYASYTMIPENYYEVNLKVAEKALKVTGEVVECGVWRGGMIAGIAELLGKERQYYLFDSFEGLPEPKEVDGEAAINWQKNTEGELYYDNCKAEIEFAEHAMKMAGAPFQCVKGWFDQTVSGYSGGTIALLRLDGDWYDSTMVCLKNLFPKVATGGVIIIDDYYTWDGCSRAVHDYLSEMKSISRINSGAGKVAYIIKKD